MKKLVISFLLSVIAICSYARDARQRTVQTVVQDVLAIVPCQDSETFNSEIGALASCAPASIDLLVSMTESADVALLARIEYALSGIATYASSEDGASVRPEVVKGFRDAIKGASDDNLKLFLLLQLRLANPAASPAPSKLAPDYTVVKAPKVSDRKYARMSDAQKAYVLYWTGESRDTSRIDFVLGQLDSESPVVAQEAVIAAGKIGTERAARALIAQLDRTDINVLPSLETFNGDIYPILLEENVEPALAKFTYVAPAGTPAVLTNVIYDANGNKVEEAPAREIYRTELSEEEKAEGFYLLFDGQDMSQWEGDLEDYKPQDGCINVDSKFGGNLYTKKEYRNFVYRFEFCFLQPAVNNGVGIRTPEGVDAAYYGMCEVQILDHDDPCYSWLNPYQVHGSVYGVIPAKRLVHKPLGEWSTEEIVVDGENVKVTVNGEVILEGNVREACRGHNVAPDGENENPYTADHQNHPGLFNEKGHISFCGHGTGLRFRNIRIKELD